MGNTAATSRSKKCSTMLVAFIALAVLPAVVVSNQCHHHHHDFTDFHGGDLNGQHRVGGAPANSPGECCEYCCQSGAGVPNGAWTLNTCIGAFHCYHYCYCKAANGWTRQSSRHATSGTCPGYYYDY